MKKTMLFAIVLALPTMILIARTANAIKIDQETEKTEEAKSAFLEIVDLWYDQKFDELYARFAYKHGGKMSKEKFINRMAAEKKRLACCWQKVQDIKVKLSSSHQATVSAKLGFEDQANNAVYVATEIPLYLKDDHWKVRAQDILSAAPDLTKHKSKKKK